MIMNNQNHKTTSKVIIAFILFCLISIDIAIAQSDSSKNLNTGSRADLLDNIEAKPQSMNLNVTGLQTCPSQTMTWNDTVSGANCSGVIGNVVFGGRTQANNTLTTSFGTAVAYCNAGEWLIESSNCAPFTPINFTGTAISQDERQGLYQKLSKFKPLVGKSINLEIFAIKSPGASLWGSEQDKCRLIVTINELGWPQAVITKMNKKVSEGYTEVSRTIEATEFAMPDTQSNSSLQSHSECSANITTSGVTLVGFGTTASQKW